MSIDLQNVIIKHHQKTFYKTYSKTMTRKILIIAILLSLFNLSKANDNIVPGNDSIQSYSLKARFETNLDSLINLWYVKNAIKTDYTGKDSLSYIPEFPDSVYIERLQDIPSIIDLSYNKIVRNYIHVYTKQRRESVETMIGVADY